MRGGKYKKKIRGSEWDKDRRRKIMIYHIFRKVIKFPRYYTYKHILETVTEIPYNRKFFYINEKKMF